MKYWIATRCHESVRNEYGSWPCPEPPIFWAHAVGTPNVHGYCFQHILNPCPPTWTLMNKSELETWLVMIS